MKLSQIIFRASLIVLTLATSLTVFAQKKNETEKWEYLITSGCAYNEFWRDGKNLFFEEIGERGWELVGISNRGNDCPEFFFKRFKVAGRVEKPLPTSPPPKTPEPEKAPQCDLTLAQAPVIRGLSLGMSVEDVFATFPGGNYDVEINRLLNAKDNLGLARFTIQLDKYPVVKDRFSGINWITFGLFDRKVVEIKINYQLHYQANWSQEQLVAKFIESLKLPGPEKWTNGSTLNCKGFQVYISNSDFLLTEKSYVNELDRRREAFHESKRQEFKP